MEPTPPQSHRHSTMSAVVREANTSSPSSKKRKSLASAPSERAQPRHVKRIKAETVPTTESETSTPVGTVTDSVYDAIVTVKVGEAAVNFGIHRGLLRRESRFFRDNLAVGEITEGGVLAGVIILKDEEPKIFSRFKDWLYSGSIITEMESSKDLSWSKLVAIYTFADRRGISGLQNSCIDTIIQKRKEGGLFPGQADINNLWKARGQVFRLRRLLLDMFAAECNLRHAISNNGSYHPKFLQGLVQTFYEMKDNETIYKRVDFWKKRKNYYVEDNENPILLD